MAVITLTPIEAPTDGNAAVNVTRSASLSTSNTYRFLNNGKCVVLIEKSGAGACTVTVTSSATVNGIAVVDPTFTVPASTGDVVIGPFACNVFNDSDGYVSFTLSNVAGLSAAVVEIE